MTDNSLDLSPHRHISFTAHYTGYIWYLLGISHERLATAKGKKLVRWLYPLEVVSEKLLGHSIRSNLQLRHGLIDQRIRHVIATHPNLQIVEMAAGLSPRGWRFRQQHADLTYLEVDLPAMATLKQQALAPIDATAPVFGCDIFTSQFDDIILHQLDRSRPVLILSEGLINYFDKSLLATLMQKISHLLSYFPQGYLISDLYPEPNHRLAKVIIQSGKLLKWLSKSNFQYHFTGPQQAAEFFKQQGFHHAHIRQAASFEQPEETRHRGDIIWIVEGFAGKAI